MTAPHITLLTLGVSDLARSRAFYEALGFVASPASQGDVVFFQSGGMALALFPRRLLAEDAHVENSVPGFSGVTIALNQRSEATCDALMALAERSGAKILKPMQKVFWGGYSGYFSDPDDHVWEVAHNPFFPLEEDGSLRLPA